MASLIDSRDEIDAEMSSKVIEMAQLVLVADFEFRCLTTLED
jgi:hypothetical protein